MCSLSCNVNLWLLCFVFKLQHPGISDAHCKMYANRRPVRAHTHREQEKLRVSESTEREMVHAILDHLEWETILRSQRMQTVLCHITLLASRVIVP